jgi:hypothetical protein
MAKRKRQEGLDKLAESFLAIRPSVMASDRKELLAEHPNISQQVLTNALLGNIRNLESGIIILAFLKARISDREKSLQEVLNG